LNPQETPEQYELKIQNEAALLKNGKSDQYWPSELQKHEWTFIWYLDLHSYKECKSFQGYFLETKTFFYILITICTQKAAYYTFMVYFVWSSSFLHEFLLFLCM
jgi:hypothetical protein